jgi:alkylhydroperoxidase family enzyme
MTMDESLADTGFLQPAPPSPAADHLYADDVAEVGYVMNLSRVWAHLPDAHVGLFDLLARCAGAAGLTLRRRGVLISALASTLGDPHCSLAWGTRLAGEAGADVAAGVLRGSDAGLDDAERALARWGRTLARDPNTTLPGDVQALREAGFDEAQIVALTAYAALRIAFSTVNDALGARPDRLLVAAAPPAVRDAVRFGRPPATREPTA